MAPAPAPTVLGVLTLVLLAAAAAPAASPAPAPLADEQVEARIREHRTADVTLTVADAAGKPLAGAAVRVRMVRHKFLFGCNAFPLRRPDVPADVQKAYQERFAGLLNFATLPFYWGSYERAEGATDAERVKAMAEWCAARGIRTKGHPLCWHQVHPGWLYERTAEEALALQLGRIGREVRAFAGLIDTWDVVNEAVVMPGYQREKNRIAQVCEQLGRVELVKQTFAAARAAGPKAVLLLNDFDTSPRYEALLRDALAAGVPIDAVGIQSHMHGGYRGAAWAWDVCERFAKFGKPLHFTELTITSGEPRKNIKWEGRYTDWPTTPEGEARQAREVAEFYRVLFSHPAVEAVTWWDFSDLQAWLGAPSGLVRRDMTPKPAYEALMRMVKKDWWTSPVEATTDAAGRVRFHGFLGDYAAEAAGGEGTFAVPKAGAADVSVRVAPRR